MIRIYRDSDYEQVKEVLELCDNFNPEIDTRESLRKKLELSPNSILVAEEDKRVVGTQYIIIDGWNSFLFRLAVHPNYRHHGIGTALQEEAERRLKSLGIKRVSFLVGEHKVEELKKMYEPRGYKPMSITHRVFHKDL